jgi:hypothetical protein
MHVQRTQSLTRAGAWEREFSMTVVAAMIRMIKAGPTSFTIVK